MFSLRAHAPQRLSEESFAKGFEPSMERPCKFVNGTNFSNEQSKHVHYQVTGSTANSRS